jgi:hypothetical protein
MLRLIDILLFCRQYHKSIATFINHRTITLKILVLLVLCSILYTAFLVSFLTNARSGDVLISQAAFVATYFLNNNRPVQMFECAVPQITVRTVCSDSTCPSHAHITGTVRGSSQLLLSPWLVYKMLTGRRAYRREMSGR